MKKGIGIAFKVLLWLLLGIIALAVAIAILIQIPAVQDFARGKAVGYLKKKLQTEVKIGHMRLGLPNTILIEDVYLEDLQQDTLLASGKLFVDISLLKLLNNKVEINEIRVEKFRSKIYRSLPDSSFNFDFIIDAFAPADTAPQPEDTSAAPLDISLGKITLTDIRLDYLDETLESTARVYIGNFMASMDGTDMENMRFRVEKAETSGLDLDYQDRKGGLETQLRLGRLAISALGLDLLKQQADLGEISLEDSRAALAFRKTEEPPVVENTLDRAGENSAGDSSTADSLAANKAAGSSNADSLAVNPAAGSSATDSTGSSPAGETGWKINIAELLVSNTALRFDDDNAPPQAAGMDYMHMALEELNVDLRDFSFSPEKIAGKLQNAAFQEKSGFLLKTFRTDFLYTDTKTFLDELYLETEGTVLRDGIRIEYPSLEAISEDPGLLSIDARLSACRLSYADMLLLAPFLSEYEPFRSSREGFIEVNGTALGLLSDLEIEKLEISTLDQTRMVASAHLKGLPDMEKAWLDVQLDELSSGRRDIGRLTNPEMIPASIRIPENVSLEGSFKGSLNNFAGRAGLRSSFGNMQVEGNMSPGGGEGKENYKARFEMINFDLGRLLRQEDTLGTVTLSASLQGSGTELETADARMEGAMKRAVYNGYEYRNLELSGAIKNQRITARADMQDPNLQFNLTTSADLSGERPALNLDLQLDTLDLKALNLYEKEMQVSVELLADFPTADPDYLNGSLFVNDLRLRLDSGSYKIDTVSLVATAADSVKTIDLASEFMTASVKGNFTPSTLAGSLMAHIDRHFKIGPGDSLLLTDTSAQRFTLTARIFDPPVLNELLPELSRLDTIGIDAAFDNRAHLLELNAQVPRVLYGSNDIDSVQLEVSTADTGIIYNLRIKRFDNPALQVLNTSLEGELAGNRVGINLTTRDTGMNERYRISGDLTAEEDAYLFSFRSGGLLLDYTEWTVEDDNLFLYSDSGFYAQNIKLSSAGQFLMVNSHESRPGADLEVSFGDFEIATLTRIAQQDSLALGGRLNGNAVLSNLDSSLVFVSDILVSDFNYNTDTVGNITLKVNNEEANAYAADIGIESDKNQVNLAGYYYPEPVNGNNFDFALDIINLDMATVQAFSFGQIRDASGGLKGSFNISGNTEKPVVTGGLAFKDISFTAAYINSFLILEDETVSLTEEGIQFGGFTVLDSLRNKAVLDGMIYTGDFSDYRFDLTLKTNNFRALNNLAGDNELYYGQLFLDSDIKIKGTLDNPDVDAYLRVNEKTNLTLLLPGEEPGVQEREGVVKFVDMGALPADTLQTDTLNTSTGITGLNFSADLEVDEEAQFTVIVDPVNGDNLKIMGDAALSIGMDPSGTISLTGRYEITEGAYELSFNLIRRRFEISKGSSITWVSDPYSADVDITAVYVAETAPLELVQDQLTGMSQTEINTFKQKMPFQVALHMEGELMKPQISFNIDLPEKEREAHGGIVYAKLQQLQMEGSELNKQVFALLVLNRFVAENPLESIGGSSVSSMARQSVSKLLSEQLNRLAGDLVGGVDLNFDLESTEDYSTGQKVNRTDLNVGLSKSLLNDRIKVSVGSSFGLEGQETRGQASTIAGDVAIDYQLSKDGRYLLRAYRANEYEGVIEGQIVETGLSFIISLNYDEFKELFQ